MEKNKHPFTRSLLRWHRDNPRDLPWKNTKDPYIIWISEIILQQTRVSQGMPYFLAFIKKFPTVESLANADQDEVLKYWEGLGYYSRARNLHFSAKYIVNELSGVFPETYTDILKLKGVGPYTAAAIASFAFDLPHAVVDGNVIRVISRYLGITKPVDDATVLKEIKKVANMLMDKSQPATYNQALMDFGATHCTPQNPNCMFCPVQDACSAYKKGLVDRIPSKKKKLKKRIRFLHYFIFYNNGKVGIHQRNKGIWTGLYQFYLVETKKEKLKQKDLVFQCSLKELNPVLDKPQKHVLTHQDLYLQFYVLDSALSDNQELLYVDPEELSHYAFPKPIKTFITHHFT